MFPRQNCKYFLKTTNLIETYRGPDTGYKGMYERCCNIPPLPLLLFRLGSLERDHVLAKEVDCRECEEAESYDDLVVTVRHRIVTFIK